MNNLFAIIVILIFSSHASAFENVTEVLPSGKILICKKSTQEIKNSEVIEYLRKSPGSRTNNDLIPVKKFNLPAPGDKIKIYDIGFGQNGRVLTKEHLLEKGMAVVIDDNLENEMGHIHLPRNTHSAMPSLKFYKLSKEEIKRIKSECIVALPDKGSNIEESFSVRF